MGRGVVGGLMRITGWVLATSTVLFAHQLTAGVITPGDLAAPFAVQPSAGLFVSSGATGPFFSVLASPPFLAPGIVDILSNIQAFDSGGSQLSGFHVTGVTLTQGSTTQSPSLASFFTPSPVTYTDSLNPFNSAIVNPANLNLAFAFKSNSSFQYSYFLSVSGIPDGGFVLYDDVEAAAVPEPATGIFLATILTALSFAFRGRLRPLVSTSRVSSGA
jgi:hypothetical protein